MKKIITTIVATVILAACTASIVLVKRSPGTIVNKKFDNDTPIDAETDMDLDLKLKKSADTISNDTLGIKKGNKLRVNLNDK